MSISETYIYCSACGINRAPADFHRRQRAWRCCNQCAERKRKAYAAKAPPAPPRGRGHRKWHHSRHLSGIANQWLRKPIK